MSDKDAWVCDRCGQPAKKPPWLRAREAGFDGSIHCGVMANSWGKVVVCGFIKSLGHPVCDFRCKTWRTGGKDEVS